MFQNKINNKLIEQTERKQQENRVFEIKKNTKPTFSIKTALN